MSRAAILAALRRHGPSSRTALAHHLSVTRTTVGAHVDDLVHEGVLEEVPAAAPGVMGRPPRPVWFTEDAGSCGAVVVLDHVVTVAVVNARGEVRAIERADAEPAAAARIAASLLRAVGRPFDGLVGVGVVAPSGGATAIAAALQTDVVTDEEVRAGAAAERWFGHGRDDVDFWTVRLGRSVGAAAVISGRVHRGRDGLAGAAAHMVVGGGRSCVCGRRGCWATVASAAGLATTATEAGHPAVGLGELLAQVADGDARARHVAEAYAADVAVGLANLDRLTAPDLIVVQGEVAAAGDWFWAHVRDAAGAGDRVVRSELDAVEVLGAAALVLDARWSSGAGTRSGRR